METEFLQPVQILSKLRDDDELLTRFVLDGSEKIIFKRQMFQFKTSRSLNLRPDEETNAILNSFVNIEKLAAYRSSTKPANTFFESLSLALYNTLENEALIRLDIMLYMRQNFALMEREYKKLGDFAETPIVTLRNCVKDAPPNTLTFVAAAHALNIELVLVYPPLNGFEDKCYLECARVFKPPLHATEGDENPFDGAYAIRWRVYICWTGPQKVTGKRWRPNRFVPLWPKRAGTGEDVIVTGDEPTVKQKSRGRSKRKAAKAVASYKVHASSSEEDEQLFHQKSVLKYPPIKEPTVKGSSVKPLSTKTSNIKPASMKDSNVKPPTMKVRKKTYKWKTRGPMTPEETEATSIACDVLDDQEDKDLRTNMTHCRRLYTVEEAYKYMLCCREICEEVPKRLISNKQFIVRCEKATEAFEDGLSWTTVASTTYYCILKPFTVLKENREENLEEQLLSESRKKNLMKMTKYEFKADWGDTSVKVVFVIERHPHLNELKFALCQYYCETSVLIPCPPRSGTLNIYAYENNATPPLVARLDPRPNTTSRYYFSERKLASFTKITG